MAKEPKVIQIVVTGKDTVILRDDGRIFASLTEKPRLHDGVFYPKWAEVKPPIAIPIPPKQARKVERRRKK